MLTSASQNRPTAPAASLRRNFAWTLAGNVSLGFNQWVMLSLIAKLGGAEMLGHYALALAVALPISMFSHLNLRTVLVTDIRQHHPFGDYLAVRLAVSTLALAVTAGAALAAGFDSPLVITVVLAGLVLAFDNLSDSFHALMQRREQMDRIARSFIARTALSAPALGLALWWAHDLAVAFAALVLVRVAILLGYDIPFGLDGVACVRSSVTASWRILRAALPLGVVLLLVSLTTNLPRYAIQHAFGARELGAFAAAASFLNAGSSVVHALGQSATSRLARHFTEGDLPAFRMLAARIAGVTFLLGLAGVAAAALLGRWLLAQVYRPEFSAYQPLFVQIMLASVLVYVAVVVGYALTSTRAFAAQVPLLALVAATSGATSWLLVPRIGLSGAALAIALAALVQLAGEILLIRARLHERQERA